QFNLTVLADGSVLATGGETKSVDGSVDLQNAAFAAERWDPGTGTWTTLAPAARVRQYHSTASLLPDGRVLTGGGGICGRCTSVGYLEKNVQYFTPPYLYKKNGSGQLATRPVIKDAPTAVSVGSRFVVKMAATTSVQKVGIVRLGAPTHGVDQGQRYVPLTFTNSGTTITATAPASGNIAPPGYYMLFVTDAAGVPSVAKMVKVESTQTSPSSTVVDSQSRCLDTRGAASTSGSAVITRTCSGGASQRWTYTDADQSMRAQGVCMGVRGATWSGSTTVVSLCSHAAAQRWERRTDGTIRPVGRSQLCLVADGRAAPSSVLIKVRTCSGGPLQQWTW
ncbi:MAG: galactose oxidase-like domain-containing protein, partial [Propionibacteriaceae bacterium]